MQICSGVPRHVGCRLPQQCVTTDRADAFCVAYWFHRYAFAEANHERQTIPARQRMAAPEGVAISQESKRRRRQCPAPCRGVPRTTHGAWQAADEAKDGQQRQTESLTAGGHVCSGALTDQTQAPNPNGSGKHVRLAHQALSGSTCRWSGVCRRCETGRTAARARLQERSSGQVLGAAVASLGRAASSTLAARGRSVPACRSLSSACRRGGTSASAELQARPCTDERERLDVGEKSDLGSQLINPRQSPAITPADIVSIAGRAGAVHG